MDLDVFYNHIVHFLRPKNTESDEPELNNIGEKSQGKNELILYNTIINAGLNQIDDMMERFVPIL